MALHALFSLPLLTRSLLRRSGAATALVLLAAGCSGDAQDKPKGRPTPQVGFIEARPSAVPMMITLGGRTVAYETSEVRPQINGIVRRLSFTQGAMVRAGQPLYEIDASLYRAAVNEAQANLASARAAADAASAKAVRYKPLAAMEAISRQDYVDALAAARQARAAVAQSGAQLDTARITLRYATVPAPISGRIGRSLVTVGALVNASQSDPLAVIQTLDPIYVDIQQSSRELVTLKRSLAQGGALPGGSLVRLKLEDGSDYALPGTVQFSEVMVNEATGTVTLRARFSNPQGVLLPGMFVQAVFEQSVDPNAFLIPQIAVKRDLGGVAYVLLVGKDGKTVRREVVTDRAAGPDWVVTKGLVAGDRVITQWTGGLKSGQPVKAVPASAPQPIAPPRDAGAGGKN